MEKERKGYIWKNGFWVKITGPAHRHKHDFFCAHCKKITGTVDDKYLEEFGICWECFTLHIEDRQVPTIDLSKYRKILE